MPKLTGKAKRKWEENLAKAEESPPYEVYKTTSGLSEAQRKQIRANKLDRGIPKTRIKDGTQ